MGVRYTRLTENDRRLLEGGTGVGMFEHLRDPGQAAFIRQLEQDKEARAGLGDAAPLLERIGESAAPLTAGAEVLNPAFRPVMGGALSAGQNLLKGQLMINDLAGAAFDLAAGAFKRSKAWRLYTETPEDRLVNARKMAPVINVPAESIVYDRETYEKAIEVYRAADEIYQKAGAAFNGGDYAALDSLYKRFPGLREVAEGEDAAAAAIVLKNLRDVWAG